MNIAVADPTYCIETELGFGGGGIVYKAWHTRLQKYVVIKELKSGTDNDVETQRNEVEALKNVKSAYLPQVIDFLKEAELAGIAVVNDALRKRIEELEEREAKEKNKPKKKPFLEGNDRIFTVIEFVEGESLDKALERGQRFTQPQVVKWYAQLSSALEAIHKQNVCHRDVKPANIMLAPSGDVCLIDFNAALVSGNDIRLISRSLGYASPEQYEIYERFSGALNAKMHLDGSSVNFSAPDGTLTEKLDDERITEIIGDDERLTEMLTENADAQKTEMLEPAASGGIDWRRSDIYSLGATMYHMLTGVQPPARARETIPISKIGNYGEGIVFVIEKSMQLAPPDRFGTVASLSEAIRDIHRFDSRWKVSQSKKVAAAIILPLSFALFAAVTIFGNSVMAQEKEERYYAAVYEIESGANPQAAYDSALAMFWDRIDPYRAMAERLWNDGDIDICRDYIEANLGNIAEFQAVPDAARSFGDIYFILGNCYYYQSGEPDYNTARGNFEIAVRFVKDNPIYYRDYAISLARTGSVAEAERVLEKAQVLKLDTDSLNLLIGEIDFAKQAYEDAAEHFGKVIAAAGDDYMRYRAYHTSDEIYKLLGQPERSVLLLEQAMNRIPLNRVPEMTERLADAYVKSGDYDNAIKLFERLAETGAPQFHIMQGLAILLEERNDFDRAAATLSDMASFFPNDYRVPMRQAYLEADRQSKIKNESRDYALTKQYYDAAKSMYSDNVKPGESDPEMQQLDYLIEQLRANKWID